jgi:mRNA-degrading endonuclease toxin of MazEF toxin-antitoxin module
MKYNQKDIIEVNVMLPDGRFKPHPVLIISNDTVFNEEGFFYGVMLSTKDYNEDFVFTLTPDMFNYKTDKTSYAKCQLIERCYEWDVMKRFGSVKQDAFEGIIKKINESVFSFQCK